MKDITRFSLRGGLVLGRQIIPGAVIVEDGRIAEIRRGDPGDLPAPVYEAPIVAPGYVDVQINGGFGYEVGTDPQAYRVLAERLPERGVTGYLPTLVTSPAEYYDGAIADFAAADGLPGARAFGLHIEGPFLSPLRKGAHRLEFVEAATPDLLIRLAEAPTVRLVTLAAEREGATDVIRRLRERGVVVSLGHTNATYEEFVRGVDAGARMATHLFNAMVPFGHRAPGAIGAALIDDRVTTGLIADGIHCHPASVALAVRAKGPDRIALISDIVAPTGMPPGRYHIVGQTVITDERTSRLEDGTLAGALATIDECVRNVVAWTDLSPAAVIGMASTVPARLLGLQSTGSIVEGFDADLILLDDALHVQATFVGGRRAFAAPALTRAD